MNNRSWGSLILIASLAAVRVASAQQPPDPNPSSDAFGSSAYGNGALYSLVGGSYGNTAMGSGALQTNSTGAYNTATGLNALESNTTGSINTAIGSGALASNTTGGGSTAAGYSALLYNTTGENNTASGYYALYHNVSGSSNTAVGVQALYTSLGSGNIALGYLAGYNATGSNNIEIGHEGVGTDSGVIRIGTGGVQKAAYVAGINASKITGSAVYITANGRLGVLASSERYKTAIEPMGSDTARLAQLRPVTFRLKNDARGKMQYGLIAEEVAKVYPELVVRDEKGRIEGVRYDELAPMLLNEVQKQQRTNAAQAEKIASLEQQLAGIQAALVNLQPKDQLVAHR